MGRYLNYADPHYDVPPENTRDPVREGPPAMPEPWAMAGRGKPHSPRVCSTRPELRPGNDIAARSETKYTFENRFYNLLQPFWALLRSARDGDLDGAVMKRSFTIFDKRGMRGRDGHRPQYEQFCKRRC